MCNCFGRRTRRLVIRRPPEYSTFSFATEEDGHYERFCYCIRHENAREMNTIVQVTLIALGIILVFFLILYLTSFPK